MSRDMIQVNKDLFSNLKTKLSVMEGVHGLVKKVCVRTNVFDQDFIKNAKLVGSVKTYWASVFGVQHNSSLYLVLLDVPSDRFISSDLFGEEQELTSGVFSLIGAEVDLFDVSKDSLYELYDNYFYDDELEFDVNGIRYLPLECLTGEARCLRLFVSQASKDFDVNIFYKNAAAIIAQSIPEGRSSRKDFNNAIVSLCNRGSDKIPFYCIINSVISIGWQHVFLELYRCIERLYGLPETKELKARIESSDTAAKLYSGLQDVTGWKPQEEGGLGKVLRCLSQETSSKLNEALALIVGANVLNVATGFYRLRNSIVHFRAGQDSIDTSEDNWENLCVILCDVIVDCYSAYESEM